MYNKQKKGRERTQESKIYFTIKSEITTKLYLILSHFIFYSNRKIKYFNISLKKELSKNINIFIKNISKIMKKRKKKSGIFKIHS